jgi:hypothetical protein
MLARTTLRPISVSTAISVQCLNTVMDQHPFVTRNEAIARFGGICPNRKPWRPFDQSWHGSCYDFCGR